MAHAMCRGGARGGASTLVHASSGAVHGAAPRNLVPLREDHPLRAVPPFAYPRAKERVERMVHELAGRRPDVRVVRIRPTTTPDPRRSSSPAGCTSAFPTSTRRSSSPGSTTSWRHS